MKSHGLYPAPTASFDGFAYDDTVDVISKFAVPGHLYNNHCTVSVNGLLSSKMRDDLQNAGKYVQGLKLDGFPKAS